MSNPFYKTVKNSVQHWYLSLIVGVIFIFAGVYTFTDPEVSLLALSLLFGISFLISGISETIFAVSNRKEVDHWGWTLVLGLLTAFIGLVLVVDPALSIITMTLYVGFVVMFRSMNAISYSIEMKNYGIHDWGWLLFMGIVGIIVSFFLVWNPIFESLTVVLWAGIALITMGIFSVFLSIRLGRLNKMLHKVSEELKNKRDAVHQEIHDQMKK